MKRDSTGVQVRLSAPDVGEIEESYARQAIRSGRLAMGAFGKRFEALVSEKTGSRHAIAVSSGTAALHLIVRALDLPANVEVITTPFSFVASTNVLLYERLNPVFVDISAKTYNIDAELAERAVSERTRAILAVDVFGEPAPWPALALIAEENDLRLIDDSCEALGASVEDKPIGSWGHAAAFGFYPNKQITTGEGGCITTDSDQIAAACRSMRNQGRADEEVMRHVRLGYNYRLSDVSAAIGCAQLERFDGMMQNRAAVANAYSETLADLAEDVLLQEQSPGSRRSWFVFVVRLADHYAADARDQLIRRMASRGIETAPYFPCIHLQPYYRDRFGYKPGDFPVAEHISARTIALPFHNNLKPESMSRVVNELREALPSLPRQPKSFAVSR